MPTHNTEEKQGASVNKANIRLTCQQSHYPAAVPKSKFYQQESGPELKITADYLVKKKTLFHLCELEFVEMNK